MRQLIFQIDPVYLNAYFRFSYILIQSYKSWSDNKLNSTNVIPTSID